MCIAIDGREAASDSMLDYLQHEMKLFDPALLRKKHHGRPVTMHLFERSVELSKHKSQREYHYPLQCILALKERNGGKLNSHLWFFSGFSVQVGRGEDCSIVHAHLSILAPSPSSRQLNPKYCGLMDVGTVPQKTALVKLFLGLENDPQLGGCW